MYIYIYIYMYVCMYIYIYIYPAHVPRSAGFAQPRLRARLRRERIMIIIIIIIIISSSSSSSSSVCARRAGGGRRRGICSSLRIHGTRQQCLRFARSYVTCLTTTSAANNGKIVLRRVCTHFLKPRLNTVLRATYSSD